MCVSGPASELGLDSIVAAYALTTASFLESSRSTQRFAPPAVELDLSSLFVNSLLLLALRSEDCGVLHVPQRFVLIRISSESGYHCKVCVVATHSSK